MKLLLLPPGALFELPSVNASARGNGAAPDAAPDAADDADAADAGAILPSGACNVDDFDES